MLDFLSFRKKLNLPLCLFIFPRFKLIHKDFHKLGLPQRKYIEVFHFIGATFNFKTCGTKDFK